MNRLSITIALLLLASCSAGTGMPAATRSPVGSISEINLAEIGPLAPKGRVQDAEYNRSRVVEELLAHGKESIPYLISKLDDQTKIDTHVIDYWSEVQIGDVALVVLTDFFTDRSLQKSTIPGAGWDEFLERGANRDLTSEQLLRNYLTRHSRLDIKTRWQQMWETHQSEIFWDEAQRCFNLRRQ